MDLESKNKMKLNSIFTITLSLALMVSVFIMMPTSSLFQIIKPTLAAPLSNMMVLPTSNVVNENANYDIFFTTATTGTIQYIVIGFPDAFDLPFTRLIERSGIGPGIFTTVPSSEFINPLLVYVVNNPVSVPAGTEIRFDIGAIKNSPTEIEFGTPGVFVATLNPSAAIIDSGTSSFAIKYITANDVSPDFMITKTLIDNAAGNAKGWNPNGALTSFTIQDSDISNTEDSIVTVNLAGGSGFEICQAYNAGGDQFSLRCNVAPLNDAQLSYQITTLPENIVTSSLSSSESSSTPPFSSSQDTGSINRQDESSSEFP